MQEVKMQEQAKEIETLKNQVSSLAELNDFFGKVNDNFNNQAAFSIASEPVVQKLFSVFHIF